MKDSPYYAIRKLHDLNAVELEDMRAFALAVGEGRAVHILTSMGYDCDYDPRDWGNERE
jgi:hypothetical protein